MVLLSGRQEKPSTSATSDPRGTLSAALRTILEKNTNSTYHDVLQEMRSFLKRFGSSVAPLLSAEHFLDLDSGFFQDPRMLGVPASLPPPGRPPMRKALTIGINYLTLPRGRGQLTGCINDSDTMISILKSIFNTDERNIRRMRDDAPDPSLIPTRNNIIRELQDLVRGSYPGDELFFHYSGHGTQITDINSDEVDGKDEALVPCDFKISGLLKDDFLRKTVVDQVPAGVRLLAVLDCCHSGSVFDMPFKVIINSDDRSVKIARAPKARQGAKSQGEVLMISGCRDDQTSADVAASSMGNRKSAGAMTMSFKHCLTKDISCHKLLQRMRRYLKKQGYSQVPQLHSEQFLRLDEPFAGYTCRVTAAQPDSNPALPEQPTMRGLPIGSETDNRGHLQMQQPSSTGSLDEQLKEMEAQLDHLRKKKAEMDQNSSSTTTPTNPYSQTSDMMATRGGGNAMSSISTTPSQKGGFGNTFGAPEQQRGPQSSYGQSSHYFDSGDNDVDREINDMESHLRQLQRKKQSLDPSSASDCDAQIASVEAHLQRLKSQRQQQAFKQTGYGGPGAGSQPTSNDLFGSPMQSQGFVGRVQKQNQSMRW